MTRVDLWQNTIHTDVEVLGSGRPPAVFLHGPWGLSLDLPFVSALAEHRTVYAPRFPGTTTGDPEAIHQLDSLHDLVVYYTELFERLGLHDVDVIGHSVGGMLACELAAAVPGLVHRLVLIDAVGLWRDDAPVKNWMILSEAQLRHALFADADSPVAAAFVAQPPDPEPRADRIWALACTAKFIWPVPDKGLQRRMHRVSAPTLIIWGGHDGIAQPVYADEFDARLSRARVARIDAAGHLPHLEQTGQVTEVLSNFLAGKCD